MDPLATWLQAHKDTLVTASVKELSAQENLRHEAEGPVRWFFDSLIQTIIKGENARLETLLRNWVTMCNIPINGQPVGLLPVLGVFKQAIWQVFQADPPSETPLALAAKLDTILGRSVEFLSKVEAAALFDAMSHHLMAGPSAVTNTMDDVQKVFISVTAHELKTPLTVIEGYTNMLKTELSEAAHPRETLMVRGIETGVARLRELIEDMIDVSLIEIDLMRLELQPMWLRRVIAIAETEIQPVLKQRQLTLEIKKNTIPAKPIVGDPERMLKAFQKVLMNAIKFTPDGGKITVFGRELSGFVDIVIEDTGIGIEPENLEVIFEKFSTLGDPDRHSSSKINFKGGGPGLGLVIARGIIEAHGGSIWAESSGTDENQLPGSRFHLMIPMRDIASGAGMSSLVASAASLVSEKTPELSTTSADQDSVRTAESRASLEKTIAVPSEATGKEAVSEQVERDGQPSSESQPTLGPSVETGGSSDQDNRV